MDDSKSARTTWINTMLEMSDNIKRYVALPMFDHDGTFVTVMDVDCNKIKIKVRGDKDE